MGKEGKEEFCNKCLFENFSHVTFLLMENARLSKMWSNLDRVHNIVDVNDSVKGSKL